MKVRFKKQYLTIWLALLIFMIPRSSNAIFGEDIPFLIEIITNTFQQLMKMKELINTGEETLDYIKQINEGINDSLGIIRTTFPDIDPGIYRDWEHPNQAIRELEKIYGIVVSSPESRVQQDTDQSVVEAIALNNSIYKYTRDVDEIGESIKNYSHTVSPGGAQKLTAESLGIMLNVLNQGLRAQATSLKLQAQTLAIQNRKEKEGTKHLLENSDALKQSLKNQETDFILPRF